MKGEQIACLLSIFLLGIGLSACGISIDQDPLIAQGDLPVPAVWDNPAGRGSAGTGRSPWAAGPRAFRAPGPVVDAS